MIRAYHLGSRWCRDEGISPIVENQMDKTMDNKVFVQHACLQKGACGPLFG